MWPIKITGNDGVVVIDGEAEGTPPSQTGSEGTNGNVVSIADGANGDLTFDVLDGGDTLLDLTAPAAPTFIAAGVYALIVGIVPAALTVGGYYTAFVRGLGIESPNVDSPPSSAGNPTPKVVLVAVGKVGAGDPLTVTVVNHDGVASVDFAAAEANIVRLS